RTGTPESPRRSQPRARHCYCSSAAAAAAALAAEAEAEGRSPWQGSSPILRAGAKKSSRFATPGLRLRRPPRPRCTPPRYRWSLRRPPTPELRIPRLGGELQAPAPARMPIWTVSERSVLEARNRLGFGPLRRPSGSFGPPETPPRLARVPAPRAFQQREAARHQNQRRVRRRADH